MVDGAAIRITAKAPNTRRNLAASVRSIFFCLCLMPKRSSPLRRRTETILSLPIHRRSWFSRPKTTPPPPPPAGTPTAIWTVNRAGQCDHCRNECVAFGEATLSNLCQHDSDLHAERALSLANATLELLINASDYRRMPPGGLGPLRSVGGVRSTDGDWR